MFDPKFTEEQLATFAAHIDFLEDCERKDREAGNTFMADRARGWANAIENLLGFYEYHVYTDDSGKRYAEKDC